MPAVSAVGRREAQVQDPFGYFTGLASVVQLQTLYILQLHSNYLIL